MKKFTAIILMIAMMLTLAVFASARVSVRGYTRSSGTYVQPHYRTNPDSYRYNNYSSYGNYNPYTGAKGYRKY